MTNKQILTAIAKVTFLGILIYFCLRYFTPRWESLQLSDRLGTLSLPWFITAAVFTLAYYILGLLIWIMILGNLGSTPDLYMTARAYVLALLPKYIPVSVAAHGIRTQLATKAGVPVVVSMKSFLLEIIFALGTAAAISIPGTMYYFPAVINHHSTSLIAAFTLVLLAIVAGLQFKLQSLNKLRLTVLRRLTDYVSVSSLYLLFWFVFGVAHWCLANALSHYSVTNLPKLTVAVSASWALGFISIFAPAGLGVREAVLYFFVNNWMKKDDIILFVTLSRLLIFSVEVFLTVGFLFCRRIIQRSDICSK